MRRWRARTARRGRSGLGTDAGPRYRAATLAEALAARCTRVGRCSAARDSHEENGMAKGQLNRGHTNKPKLTAKEKAKKKKAKKEKAVTGS